MSDQGHRFCTSCGHRLSPGNAFCINCGAALGVPAANAGAPTASTGETVPSATSTWATSPTQQAPTVVPATRARRRTGLVTLLVLLLVLLLGGTASAGYLLLHKADPSTLKPSAGVTDPASTAPTAEEEPTDTASTASASPSVTASAATAAPEPEVRCWDGSTVADLVDCPGDPSGLQALAWLFPGLDSTRCFPREISLRVIYECSESPVTIHVSHWNAFQAGEEHYTSNLGTAPENEPATGRVFWRGIAPGRGTYKVAVMYDQKPWGVTVYAPAIQGRAKALRALKMRPSEEYLGAVLD